MIYRDKYLYSSSSCTSSDIHSSELIVALRAIGLHTGDVRQHGGRQMMQYACRSGSWQPIRRHLGAHMRISQLLLHAGGEVIVVAKIKSYRLLIGRGFCDRQIGSLGERLGRHDVQKAITRIPVNVSGQASIDWCQHRAGNRLLLLFPRAIIDNRLRGPKGRGRVANTAWYRWLGDAQIIARKVLNRLEQVLAATLQHQLQDRQLGIRK